MPSLPKSIFDESYQTNAQDSTTSATAQQDQYSSTTKTTPYDPEVSSIFTQTTINDSSSTYPTTSSSRFGFLKRNKSKNDPQQESLVTSTEEGKEKEKEKKKSRFENPFKPHEQTDEDRAIMEKMRERLGSREEAIRQGGAQPAGFRGVGGGYAAGGPWTGGM
ncbi:hypothetical protein AUEXF2481DRAFT_552269 [Aureobasidium subglaciale EXF-2481]|uniref:Uncharacterized protein n=1 Tax=Aureobasidium subglaciale (strain EXF-2481) TaxID=1043005 RepID=A0A074YJ78_AURSE|nr:uncharacterized protein AUEXF2481DRAFT_552269 [Aureobasidium subglaciale EXF-2481]KAI5204284.1 hypothetical protein E4T38_04704 [Aureobasidium subglaciale]KAI5223046.1 hypothetical protein E4T40_04698 [Aureobasidium subglaciale]KAI5226765.1 hypothetical protein E4T41_04641 [Aureobasidium subglaciale]KAI5262403.1 hypothetical protein E4T46_04527 [Aureobasidium subglaciale]KEQ97873.1 hypothetical protein AUEXF2481DRAFT_552269 [Aureobasidium subglaciale EXF-2481]